MTCSSYFGMSAFGGLLVGLVVCGFLVWVFLNHLGRTFVPPEVDE